MAPICFKRMILFSNSIISWGPRRLGIAVIFFFWQRMVLCSVSLRNGCSSRVEKGGLVGDFSQELPNKCGFEIWIRLPGSCSRESTWKWIEMKDADGKTDHKLGTNIFKEFLSRINFRFSLTIATPKCWDPISIWLKSALACAFWLASSKSTVIWYTLPETKVAPENWWLEDEISFRMAYNFQVQNVSFRECSLISSLFTLASNLPRPLTSRS